ncbi:ImmA/IrrE family metallo-endopeptidase [Sporosarcina sp. OR05]|uniref:ImmA/IrrE family metallo-endopeptidase n=1 Tax=Sporosarcina sp. OR05 TaxID=2969819 RepID=UPI00352AECCF
MVCRQLNFTQNQMEKYVHDLLEDIDIKHPIQLNKFDISDRLGVYLHLYEGRSRGFEDEKEKYIFLNKNLTRPERFQDFAHELGHILLHAGDQRKMHPLLIQLQEGQANSFMYELCVPTFMLENLHLPMDKQLAIQHLTCAFNVTSNFAAKRLNRYYQRIFTEWIAHGGF